MSDKPKFTVSCGNVFADLGLPDPERHLLKAKIVFNLQKIIEERELSAVSAAVRMDLDPQELNQILVGDFSEYSVYQLLKMVNALGSDVQIVISSQATKEEKASLSVVTA